MDKTEIAILVRDTVEEVFEKNSAMFTEYDIPHLMKLYASFSCTVTLKVLEKLDVIEFKSLAEEVSPEST